MKMMDQCVQMIGFFYQYLETWAKTVISEQITTKYLLQNPKYIQNIYIKTYLQKPWWWALYLVENLEMLFQ
jgi:hypothetical protein